MNANHIRVSLLAVFAAAASTGAVAHTEYSESGTWHWVQHVAEAKSQPRGVLGPVRNDPEQPASTRMPLNGESDQPAFSPLRGLGGIGGDKTSRTDSLTMLAKVQPRPSSSPFDGLGGIGGKDTSRSDSLATTA